MDIGTEEIGGTVVSPNDTTGVPADSGQGAVSQPAQTGQNRSAEAEIFCPETISLTGDFGPIAGMMPDRQMEAEAGKQFSE